METYMQIQIKYFCHLPLHNLRLLPQESNSWTFLEILTSVTC